MRAEYAPRTPWVNLIRGTRCADDFGAAAAEGAAAGAAAVGGGAVGAGALLLLAVAFPSESSLNNGAPTCISSSSREA